MDCPFPIIGRKVKVKILRTFKVNGKSYKSKELDFNAMCDLEDMGVSMVDIKSKSLSLIRAYLSFCGNMSVEEAGNEVMLHLQNGGKFDEIMEELKTAIENSDFFRILKERAEEEDAENQTEESQKSENTEP